MSDWPSGAAGAQLAVDAASLYPEDDGFFGRRAKKRRARLLAGLERPLSLCLAAGEQVRWAARGYRYSTGEYYFAGVAAYVHNQVALVLTDRRLLLLQIDRRGRPGDIKNQVLNGEIRRAARTFLSGWAIHLADGTRLAFAGIPSADRKRMSALLPPSQGPRSPAPSLQHLCPACLRLVPGPVGAVLVCPEPSCRIPFRDPRRAARLSALVPGLGDLYLRHHFFGSLEFLGSMVALGLGLGVAAAILSDGGWPLALLVLALFIALPRVIDYFVTRHMGRKGLVPLAMVPAPGAQLRNLPSFPRWAPVLFLAGVVAAAAFPAAMAGGMRRSTEVRKATEAARQGRFEEAEALTLALEAKEPLGEEGRLRIALALQEAGDLLGASRVAEGLEGKPVEKALADRWNAAHRRQEAAFRDYREGLEALERGEEAASWTALDRALGFFAGVKRPHLPRTRGELRVHLARDLLGAPANAPRIQLASSHAGAAHDAPPAELAVVRSALHAARGEHDQARAALGGVDEAGLDATFRLLALETRLRIATGDEERQAVAGAARAFDAGALDDDDRERLEALAGGRASSR